MYQERYWQEAQFAAVETLKTAVEKRGFDVVSVAVAWVLARPSALSGDVGTWPRR
jgi:aryl-alcohol dehydrogenase (NADP+)